MKMPTVKEILESVKIPPGLFEDGDVITIDAETNTLNVDLSDSEIETRKTKWVQPAYKFTKGVLFKYIKSVATASEGCVTDTE